MGYSTRGITHYISNYTDSENHERVGVRVYDLTGKLLETIERTVFINVKGERVVRFKRAEHKLRKKHGFKDCVIIQEKST